MTALGQRGTWPDYADGMFGKGRGGNGRETAAVAEPVAHAGSARRLSLLANFTWVTAGQATYAITQGLILVVLARLTTPETVGHFALALAVTTPIVQLAHMRLRDVLATDAAGDFSLTEYLMLMALTGAASLVLVLLVSLAFGYSGAVLLIIFVVGVAKVIEVFSHIHYGAQQRAERMDRLGVSLMLRGAFGAIGMTVGILITDDLVWGVIGMAAGWGLVLARYDWPRGREAYPAVTGRTAIRRRLRTLAWMALPLGIMQMATSMGPSIPRLFLERTAGAASLGVFAGMAYLVVGMSTIARALAQTAAPRLGQRFAEGDTRGFLRITRRQVQIALVMGGLGLAGAALVGRQLLTFLYGPEYGVESRAFVAFMVYATVLFTSMQLTQVLIAARQLRQLMVLAFIVVGVSVALASLWIGDHGIGGAVAVLIATGSSGLIGQAVLLRRATRERGA